MSGLHRPLPGVEIRLVLHQEPVHLAIAVGAKGQLAARVQGGEADAIAMQASLGLGQRPFIPGTDEALGADPDIAGLSQFLDHAEKQGQGLGRAGQGLGIDGGLMGKIGGDVAVAETADAVGAHGDDLLQGRRQGGLGLFGQAMNEIETDVVEAHRPRHATNVADHGRRVDPANRPLHFPAQVLHPQAEAAEAKLAQQLQLLRGGATRVAFDAGQGRIRDLEVIVDDLHQPGQVFIP